MQFRKLFFSLCCMVALGASLAACSEDEELFDDSGSKVTLPTCLLYTSDAADD